MQATPTDRPLGLFGGRFDPVHRAHVNIARAVADQLHLTEIRWIVTGDPVHKPAYAAAADRLAMVRLAVDELRDSRMHTDDREIRAAALGQSNYTADTVAGLKQEFPGRTLVWILGEDQLEDFLTWSRWEWLIQEVELAVCARPQTQSHSAAATIAALGGTIHWVDTPSDAVSSSTVRELVHQQRSTHGLIAPSVANYIATHRLYA